MLLLLSSFILHRFEVATMSTEDTLSLNFSVIGDSNVQRNLVDYNYKGRQVMAQAQMIPCTSLSTFATCLPKIRPEANVLILSILSNFIRDSEPHTDVGK